MGRNKKKKYLARQTDQLKIDDKSLLETLDHYDYGDDEGDGSADYEEDSSDAPSEVTSSYFSTPTYSAAGIGDTEEAEADRPMLEMVGPARLTETPKKWSPVPTADDEAEFIEKRKFFDFRPFRPEKNLTTTVTSTTSTTTEYYDAMTDPDFDEAKHYFYRYSQDKFIKNKYIKIHLDDKSLVTLITLSNGIKVALTIQLCYYVSDDPVKLGRLEQRPGSNVFRPMDPLPVKIQEHLRAVVQKTYMVEEVQYSLANWAGFVLRVYVDRPVIELDWVVGPVPISDNFGKDVFIRYTTDLANKGVFYTDSNGRQTIKRRRNKRPSYDPVQTNIPSNIYPVTSKIYIEDTRKNIRFSVFNDRSQGGTSLRDGQIDLMVHRRILTNEHREGAEPWLNDTEYGQGIVVRGKHYLYFSKADHKLNKIFEKKFAKEVELAPQIFASPYRIYGTRMKEVWFGQTNEYHGVIKKLPLGVHVLTLQEWDDNALLLRLENYLELSDVIQAGVRTVFVKDLFANITITSLRETTLGGNVWFDDYMSMQWNVKDRYVKNFNDFYGGNGSVEYSTNDFVDREKPNLVLGIKLIPQQIRTFVATYEFRTI